MSNNKLLATDELTVLLGLIAASTFLLRNLYKPQFLVHPILLGRQSDASRVRNPGESAQYRNYGTGMMGRLPIRPSKEIQTLPDFLRSDLDSARTLWSSKVTNAELNARIAAVGTGLIRHAGLSPESNVLLLLNDGIEFLITDLALASHGIPSFTLSSLNILSDVLESHPPSAIVTDAAFLPQLLELVHDAAEGEHHTIITVGGGAAPGAGASHVRVLSWETIEQEGAKGDFVPTTRADPNTVFTVAFYVSPEHQLRSVRFTHQNLTAGVAATRTILPLAQAISPLDTIVSAHSLSTPYGRTIAYTALYEGACFTTTPSTKITGNAIEGAPTSVIDLKDLTSAISSSPIPSPSILFIKPQHLTALSAAVLAHAQRSLWFPIARRQKLAGQADGHLTSDGLWDRLVLDGARQQVLGEDAGSLRAAVVTGTLDAAALPDARLALSFPVLPVHAHPAVAGPVCAAHPFDLQAFPLPDAAAKEGGSPFARLAHAGPPAINVDAKLAGVVDADVETGGDPVGELLVRGPSVGAVREDDGDGSAHDEWVPTGERATVRTNGTFRIVLRHSQ